MSTHTSQPAPFVDLLARNREAVVYVLLSAVVVMLVVTFYCGIRWEASRPPPPSTTVEKKEQTAPEKPAPAAEQYDYDLPAALWSGFCAIVCATGAGWLLSRAPTPETASLEIRYALVTVGGLTGMATALFGFALCWLRQESLMFWVSESNMNQARRVIGPLAVLLAGIALMFFAMQPARGEERNDVFLRRSLYGVNTVLSGLLLLLVLSIANIVVFLKLPENVITTVSGFTGLSDRSKEFLATINDDVQIHLIMPENFSARIDGRPYFGFYNDCRGLLNDVHAQNNGIRVIALSPAADAEAIQKLMKDAKIPEDAKKEFGMLITYGKSDKLYAFISADELWTPTQQGVRNFQGENRLMTELNFLSGGAKRPVVYFTQSNGEVSIGGPGAEGGSGTARQLVRHLTDRKYDVKPLRLDPGSKIDLSDATMVMIAAPRYQFTREQVEILNSYMIPKGNQVPGKLVALLAATPAPDGNVSPTGLEDLLARFGVQCEPKKRLFTLARPEIKPQFVIGTFADEARRAGLAMTRLLGRNEFLLFGNVRPISALPPRPGEQLKGVNLLATAAGVLTYRDERYDSNASELVAQLRRESPENLKKIRQEKEVTLDAVPFGVFVAEQTKEGDRPRLLVIGSDTLCSDEAMRQTPTPEEDVELMGKMLDVVRERPQGMNIEPRSLGAYTLKKESDSVGLYLPVWLTILGIFALGGGVWVARRK